MPDGQIADRKSVVEKTRYDSGAEAVPLGAHLLACSPDGGVREVSRLAEADLLEKGPPMAQASKLPESKPRDAGAARRPAPCWDDVVEVIERLAVTGAVLPTSLGLRNQIATYQRGRRLCWIPQPGSHGWRSTTSGSAGRRSSASGEFVVRTFSSRVATRHSWSRSSRRCRVSSRATNLSTISFFPYDAFGPSGA